MKNEFRDIKFTSYHGTIKLNECCSNNNKIITKYDKNDNWIIDEINTEKGLIPVISTSLDMRDKIGGYKVRWGIGRSNYKINAGLYAVGIPDKNSHVLVSSNYKLTFDMVRKELKGINCWLLILDTNGVNVWCAAGKGTFGTKELARRIAKTKLDEIVSHKRLILPQLGATGISAHEILRQTGFTVIYGPVRANDVKKFIDAKYEATEEMRTVKFTIYDRLVLTPVELVSALKFSLKIFGIIFLINLFASRTFSILDLNAYIGTILIGTVITPVLLPYVPGRAFAWKGWLLGLIWSIFIVYVNGWFNTENIILAIGYLLVLPSLSAYLSMNFTGSSTYTSFSGVMKEMKGALPLIIISMILGIILILVKTIIG